MTHPGELARSARAVVRTPRRLLQGARDGLQAMGALGFAGMRPAPPTPLNVKVGPHRRYTWVDAELSALQRVKDSLGGTVNDAVLAVVAGALGRFLRHRGVDTEGLQLRALVPVLVRGEGHGRALGSEVAPLWVSLPVGIEDPVRQHAAIRDATAELRDGQEAIGARALTELAGFAPPTIMSQAARLQQRQRFFNLVITNVPGPQQPLYLLGRRLRALYPVVPLAGNQALGVAVTSYDGRLGFGLLGDYDALADLDTLADMLRTSMDALADGASVPRRAARGRRATRTGNGRPRRADRPPDGLADGRQGALRRRHDRPDRAARGGRGRVLRLARRRDGSSRARVRPRRRAPGRRRACRAPGQRRPAAQRRAPDVAAARARRAHGRPAGRGAAAAGQAVLVRQRPNLDVPVTAVTARRMVEASGPDDPALEAFIEYWLGRTG